MTSLFSFALDLLTACTCVAVVDDILRLYRDYRDEQESGEPTRIPRAIGRWWRRPR